MKWEMPNEYIQQHIFLSPYLGRDADNVFWAGQGNRIYFERLKVTRKELVRSGKVLFQNVARKSKS